MTSVTSGGIRVENLEPPSSRVPDLAPSSGAPKRNRVAEILGPIAVFIVFVGIWYVLAEVILPKQKRFLLPPPHRVISDGFLVWHDGNRGLKPILDSLALTARVAIVGLVITIILGMGLATAMSLARWVERASWPYLVALQAAPILALTPLISGLLGFGFTSRVLVVILIAFFPIVNNTLFGLLSVDQSQHELFTLQGASRATRLWKLQYPAAMPSIFVGLRNAAGLAVIGAVVGDFYFRQGNPGIGAQIDIYRQRLYGPEMITAIILSALLAHTGWHSMVERAERLSQYSWQWPTVTAGFILDVTRWLMAAVALAGVAWLAWVTRRLWIPNAPQSESKLHLDDELDVPKRIN
jgi:NitT/TauT family transport system permease protein